jgi:hypothetical protein
MAGGLSRFASRKANNHNTTTTTNNNTNSPPPAAASSNSKNNNVNEMEKNNNNTINISSTANNDNGISVSTNDPIDSLSSLSAAAFHSSFDDKNNNMPNNGATTVSSAVDEEDTTTAAFHSFDNLVFQNFDTAMNENDDLVGNISNDHNINHNTTTTTSFHDLASFHDFDFISPHADSKFVDADAITTIDPVAENSLSSTTTNTANATRPTTNTDSTTKQGGQNKHENDSSYSTTSTNSISTSSTSSTAITSNTNGDSSSQQKMDIVHRVTPTVYTDCAKDNKNNNTTTNSNHDSSSSIISRFRRKNNKAKENDCNETNISTMNHPCDDVIRAQQNVILTSTQLQQDKNNSNNDRPNENDRNNNDRPNKNDCNTAAVLPNENDRNDNDGNTTVRPNEYDTIRPPLQLLPPPSSSATNDKTTHNMTACETEKLKMSLENKTTSTTYEKNRTSDVINPNNRHNVNDKSIKDRASEAKNAAMVNNQGSIEDAKNASHDNNITMETTNNSTRTTEVVDPIMVLEPQTMNANSTEINQSPQNDVNLVQFAVPNVDVNKNRDNEQMCNSANDDKNPNLSTNVITRNREAAEVTNHLADESRKKIKNLNIKTHSGTSLEKQDTVLLCQRNDNVNFVDPRHVNQHFLIGSRRPTQHIHNGIIMSQNHFSRNETIIDNSQVNQRVSNNSSTTGMRTNEIENCHPSGERSNANNIELATRSNTSSTDGRNPEHNRVNVNEISQKTQMDEKMCNNNGNNKSLMVENSRNVSTSGIYKLSNNNTVTPKPNSKSLKRYHQLSNDDSVSQSNRQKKVYFDLSQNSSQLNINTPPTPSPTDVNDVSTNLTPVTPSPYVSKRSQMMSKSQLSNTSYDHHHHKQFKQHVTTTPTHDDVRPTFVSPPPMTNITNNHNNRNSNHGNNERNEISTTTTTTTTTTPEMMVETMSFDELLSKFQTDLLESTDVRQKCDTKLVDLRVQLCVSENIALRLHGCFDDILEDIENAMP